MPFVPNVVAGDSAQLSINKDAIIQLLQLRQEADKLATARAHQKPDSL